MKIGQLNRRVELKIVDVTKDEYGGVNDSYATTATLWANVKPISNKVLYLQGQSIDRNRYEITLRQRNISKGSILVYEGKQLTIIGSPQEITEGNKRYINFIAEENGTGNTSGGNGGGSGTIDLYRNVSWDENNFVLSFENGSHDPTLLLMVEVWQNGQRLLVNSINNPYPTRAVESGSPLGRSIRYRQMDKGTFTIKWYLVISNDNLTPISEVRQGQITNSILSYQERYLITTFPNDANLTSQKIEFSSAWFPAGVLDYKGTATNEVAANISEWQSFYQSNPTNQNHSLELVTQQSSNNITSIYLLRFAPLNNEWPSDFDITNIRAIKLG